MSADFWDYNPRNTLLATDFFRDRLGSVSSVWIPTILTYPFVWTFCYCRFDCSLVVIVDVLLVLERKTGVTISETDQLWCSSWCNGTDCYMVIVILKRYRILNFSVLISFIIDFCQLINIISVDRTMCNCLLYDFQDLINLV